MFLFYVLSFFKKGDTIEGGTLFKGGYYLRKYGKYLLTKCDRIQEIITYITFRYLSNRASSCRKKDNRYKRNPI